MGKLTSFIAETGENPNFVAFMAHMGFIFMSLTLTYQYVSHSMFSIWSSLVTVLIKEFWFDLKFEQTPPQTFWDSVLDFVGYSVGIAIAWFVWFHK